MEGDAVGVGFAVGAEHLHAAAGGFPREFRNDATLADSRRTDHADHCPASADGLVEDSAQCGEFPYPSYQGRVVPAPTGISGAQQTIGRDGRVRAFDEYPLGFAEHGGVADQVRGGFADRYPARRRGRFHPLRHAHLNPDGGVAARPGIDITGDDLTGIQADPQSQVDAVEALGFSCQQGHLVLDIERGQAGPKSMILQGNWGTEQCHDAVAGELVHRAAIALHHRRRTVEDRGHDVAEPLRFQRGGQVHGADHIGEQNSHLFVFSRPRLCCH